MKPLMLGFVLIAMPALADDEVASIRLYTDFQHTPPDVVTGSIRDELAKIMAPMGLIFKWTSIAENRGNETSVRLAVIHFAGHCDGTDPGKSDARPGALGWTYMEDGAILPFSDIDCDGIRAFLQADLRARPKEEQEGAFGRAVARVLAHELYHIFVNTARHGSRGVAKPYYTPQELLSDSFPIEQVEYDNLRRYWSDLVTGGF